MMDLYSNIKRLRKLHNMSQQELAEAVGYKGKSMIAQVENGKVDLSASMITKFAEVLNVSELELMGISGNAVTEPPEIYLISSPADDKKEELYSVYEGLTPEKQVAFEAYLKFLQSQS